MQEERGIPHACGSIFLEWSMSTLPPALTGIVIFSSFLRYLLLTTAKLLVESFESLDQRLLINRPRMAFRL